MMVQSERLAFADNVTALRTMRVHTRLCLGESEEKHPFAIRNRRWKANI